MHDGLVTLCQAANRAKTIACCFAHCTGRAQLKGGSTAGRYRWQCKTCGVQWSQERDTSAGVNVRICDIGKRPKYRCRHCKKIKVDGCVCKRFNAKLSDATVARGPTDKSTTAPAITSEHGLSDEQRKDALNALKTNLRDGSIDDETFRRLVMWIR